MANANNVMIGQGQYGVTMSTQAETAKAAPTQGSRRKCNRRIAHITRKSSGPDAHFKECSNSET